jgi:hypothetical protein
MAVAPKETSFADSGEVKGGNIKGKPGSGSSLCRSSLPFLQQLLPTLWQFFWRAVLPHCREIRRIRRCALQKFLPTLVGEKSEHHTSHLALRTVFLMFTSLMPNDFGAKPLHLLALSL